MAKLSLSLIAGIAGLTMSAGAANAFSEVQTAPAGPGAAMAERSVQAQAPDGTDGQTTLPVLQLIDPDTVGSSDAADGTPLSLPGIGYIGTLPKMDFGLELLYSSPDSSAGQLEMNNLPPAADAPMNATDDDVIIRGTLKHRF